MSFQSQFGNCVLHIHVFLSSPLILQIVSDIFVLHFKKHTEWRINWGSRANEKSVVETEISFKKSKAEKIKALEKNFID